MPRPETLNDPLEKRSVPIPGTGDITLAGRLRELIDTDGGFTIRLREGETVDSGISVATRPSESMSFAREQWCDKSVANWLREVSAHSGWRNSHVGGWLDPVNGSVHLDVVVIVPGSLRAIARCVGRRFGQHCVFDLRRKETMVLR